VHLYARSLPVTWLRWRSHLRFAISENPMPHENFTSVCVIETELLPIEVLHCGNRDFRLFPPVTLILTRWPSYTNLTRIPERCTGWMNENKLTMWKVSKVIVWQTHRHTDVQTDKQTDALEIIYTTPLRECQQTQFYVECGRIDPSWVDVPCGTRVERFVRPCCNSDTVQKGLHHETEHSGWRFRLLGNKVSILHVNMG